MRITVASPISGPEAFVFERMSVYEELGRPFRYDIYLLSSSRNISLSSVLGENLVVHVELQPGASRHFGGIVTKASALGAHGRSARYYVQLRPWLSLLQHRATCRIWQNKTVLDVLRDVSSQAGFTIHVASRAILTGREWEYIVQYRESDYNFFMRLLEQEGYYFYVRQEKNKHEIFLTDDLLDHDSVPDDRRIAFQPPAGSRQTADDVFNHWTINEQVRTTHYELDDYNYKDARADLFARSGGPAELPKTGNKGEDHPDRLSAIFDYPGEYITTDDAATLTKLRQQELRVDRQTISAAGNIRDLSAGAVFKLFDHPQKDQNAKYAVTVMDLTVEAAAVESGKGGEDFTFRGNYALLNTSLPFRLKRTSVKPVIAGLQTAVVVGPPGEEIKTDEFGRVRVKFRWDRSDDKDHKSKNQGEEKAAAENSSCWIRVMQPWASNGFGFQFIPRIGDEVVVQFLEGDPDRPLITGSVYNNVNRFPYTPGSKPTQSGIKTRSSKKGGADNANMIRFEDEKGAEELFVQAERNQTVKVKADRSLSVGGNESHSVTGTRDTTITKKNTDTYKDEHEMNVTKKVVEVFSDEHWLHVTKKQTIEVTNDKSELVTGSYDLTTDTKFLLTQGGTTMQFEGGAADMNVSGALTIVRGAGRITIDEAGMIALESTIGITLQCGPSKVELTPAGVAVSGVMVKLNM